MLYLLLYDMHEAWAPLNVFKYITFRTMVAALTALTLSLLLGPTLIRRLTALQWGQSIRDDGPAAHAKKAGTPTMGGTLILFTLLLATLLLADLSTWYVWVAILVTLGHGLIGFFDDFAKVRRRNSKGLPGRLRLGCELAIGAAAAATIYAWSEHGGHVTMPFLKDVRPDLGLWYIPFGALVIAGAANAVNLTDGLDGLAIGPVMINAGTYLLWAYIAGLVLFGRPIAQYLDIPGIVEMGELSIFAASVIGAGIGFLWYNTYPAQVFMGDVGSLALGGGLGMLAVLTKNELLSIVIGGIFFVET
ncbi:MAG TPA: phospho-N-acetylmuramoyl-pentapeptide-transferase, partial [Candidatus Binatia bacterium]|nr:phospho-N-acetylmuramoyl-pentapeptide-transferase [Candidatus Binatia bacterium]